jgi:beta-lactamase regulating signal transducer with metallopeptidase domain
MIPWLRTIAVTFHPAMTLLVIVTILLLIAILICKTVTRSSLGRHTVLLVALLTVGFCPAMLILAHLLDPVALMPLPNLTLLDGSGSSASTQLLQKGTQSVLLGHSLIFDIVLGFYAVGTLIGVARLIRGLHMTNGVRRAAKPLSFGTLGSLQDRLVLAFGHTLPEILVSESVSVPVALGSGRPAVVFPSAFLAQFNDDQVLQMLIHECAHALRRDPLVALYQQVLASALWFHPLVHVANRLLNQAREEVCDNHVLQSASPTEYSRTLVSVAQSISPMPYGWFAPTLVQSDRYLENRVLGLLNPRRSRVTKLSYRRVATISLGFASVAFLLSCFAATPASQPRSANELSHSVRFTLGKTNIPTGDGISIDEVQGTSDTLTAGNLYQVKGTYKLASQDRATLAAFVTTSQELPGGSTPVMRTQKMTVSKGEGSFTLLFYMWQDGSPHVSFYPSSSGNSFAEVYFGSGASPSKSAQ